MRNMDRVQIIECGLTDLNGHIVGCCVLSSPVLPNVKFGTQILTLPRNPLGKISINRF